MKQFVSPGRFTDSGFNFFSLFVFNKILQVSLRRFNFIMTFFSQPLECKQWQSSNNLGSIVTSVFSKGFKNFDSRPLLATLTGTPKISRYFLFDVRQPRTFLPLSRAFTQFSIYVSSDLYSSNFSLQKSDFSPDTSFLIQRYKPLNFPL